MKETAVEWLVHELDKQMIERDKFDAFDWIFEDLIKQAKEMEKQQMKDASCPYVGGWEDDEFEEYYNKTYKQVTNKN
jgi:hypothetical protein